MKYEKVILTGHTNLSYSYKNISLEKDKFTKMYLERRCIDILIKIN
jgi:hypothetical protein